MIYASEIELNVIFHNNNFSKEDMETMTTGEFLLYQDYFRYKMLKDKLEQSMEQLLLLAPWDDSKGSLKKQQALLEQQLYWLSVWHYGRTYPETRKYPTLNKGMIVDTVQEAKLNQYGEKMQNAMQNNNPYGYTQSIDIPLERKTQGTYGLIEESTGAGKARKLHTDIS